MNKKILLLGTFIALFLGCADRQKLVVIQDEHNHSKATLSFYENNTLKASYAVLVGRNGIADDSAKKEGDGKTPFGEYNITTLFGKEELRGSKMPFIKTNNSIHCVDDTKSSYYNRIVDSTVIKKDYDSFENMLRDDGVYDIGAVIAYNDDAVKGNGSCIFIHIKNKNSTPTSGCIALGKDELVVLLKMLDIKKRPTIEIKNVR